MRALCSVTSASIRSWKSSARCSAWLVYAASASIVMRSSSGISRTSSHSSTSTPYTWLRVASGRNARASPIWAAVRTWGKSAVCCARLA